MSLSAGSDQEDRFRNQKLEYAQNKLTGMNGVNPALHNVGSCFCCSGAYSEHATYRVHTFSQTLYFM